MKCKISVSDPSILSDAQPGDFFLLQNQNTRECVLARLDAFPDSFESLIRGPDAPIRIVVIACRVDEGEPGYHATGVMMMFDRRAPIQFVEQVEVASFRERMAQRVHNTHATNALLTDILTVASGKELPGATLTVADQAEQIRAKYDKASIHIAYAALFEPQTVARSITSSVARAEANLILVTYCRQAIGAAWCGMNPVQRAAAAGYQPIADGKQPVPPGNE